MKQIQYGIEKFGRLKTAMLHRPDLALPKITEENREFFLFDKVPDVDKYLEEHEQYCTLLQNQGVTVHRLSEHVHRNIDLLERLPNLAYMHDIAVISSHGAILSKMSSRGRCHEEIVVREALNDLGIPALYEPYEGEDFEGCLLLSSKTVFVADTERHSRNSIKKFIEFILRYFDEVIYALIPQDRRFMHPDMVLNRITDQLMVYFPPAFLQTYLITKEISTLIDIKQWMKEHGVDLIPLSDKEQRQWGSSFVPLEPGVIINYDISLESNTIHLLEQEGVRFIHFHPEALLAGGGSLRCLTMRLWRNG
ncbi:arginine deiminase family protein [Candidatus Formimonas warabiya]|uniref:Arginine deiminase n=1 Tax=Formimonas warabiya TaxID=1761012 RepID=A0A3G1KWJ9_FORW1|nr:arginine deiminase family protein [Candidatus Formimonas warabiya]ATW26767.1 arginine deiminase [Candidatus Formimonas warabiya]